MNSVPQRGQVNSHQGLGLSRPARSGGLYATTNALQLGTGQIDPAATTSSRSSKPSSIELACTLYISTVTKNAGPKKIFPIFPHMAQFFLPPKEL